MASQRGYFFGFIWFRLRGRFMELDYACRIFYCLLLVFAGFCFICAGAIKDLFIFCCGDCIMFVVKFVLIIIPIF